MKYLLSFAGMFLYVYLVISVCYVNYVTPPIPLAPNLPTGAVVTWFKIEIQAWIGILLSNITFMTLRFFIKNKVDYSQFLEESKKLPSIDTMLALHEAGTVFHTEFVPAYVSGILTLSDIQSNVNFPRILEASLQIVLFSACTGLTLVTVLIFVDWKKGPKTWKKIAPYVFFCFLIIVYFVLPALNIGIQVYEILLPSLDLKESYFESWLTLYMCVCIARIAEYFFKIRPTWIVDARIFMANRTLYEAMTSE